jgi:hypothetical protein
MQFDSSWLPEGAQKAIITVDYGSGQNEALRWESDSASPAFHPESPNETVLIPLNNPAGSSTLIVRFKYLDAGNNWYWAFDNLQIGTVPEPASAALVGVGLLSMVAAARRRKVGRNSA